MNRTAIYGIIGVVAAITVAAYVTERGGLQISGPGSESAALPGAAAGRQPGDQRVRSNGSGAQTPAGAEVGTPAVGNGRGRGGGGRQQQASQRGAGRSGSAGRTGRLGDHGGAAPVPVGTEAVPVFVNGVRKGEIAGAKLEQGVPEVSVAIRRNVRGGWPVTEALKLSGIDRAGKATFVNRKGESTTMEWAQLASPEPLYILTYTQGGQLMLTSGAKISSDEAGGKASRRGRKARVDPAANAVTVSDIVKIELSQG